MDLHRFRRWLFLKFVAAAECGGTHKLLYEALFTPACFRLIDTDLTRSSRNSNLFTSLRQFERSVSLLTLTTELVIIVSDRNPHSGNAQDK